MYVFKNFYYPETRIFWIYEKLITCTVVLACYVQRGGCTQAVYSEFSRSDLGPGQKRMKVKISIYLNNMITCLRLRLRATLHGQAGPGIPLSIKMHVIDAVKETCQSNLTKHQDALSTSLCCLWKFLQLNQVRVETLPSSYAMAKIVLVPCSIFYLQGFSTIQGNDSLCRN